MATGEVHYVIRIWLPDRPGALGAVAARIGAARGDVVAIDVLERGGGRAVDELTVALPGPDLLPLLLAEVSQVDGVDVEDLRPVLDGGVDRAVAALEAARVICAVADPLDLESVFASEARALLHADWVAVLDAGAQHPLAVSGTGIPSVSWLEAFVRGAEGPDGGAVDELAFCPVRPSGHVILSRRALPLRTVERELLAGLAGVVEERRGHLARGDSDTQPSDRSTARRQVP